MRASRTACVGIIEVVGAHRLYSVEQREAMYRLYVQGNQPGGARANLRQRQGRTAGVRVPGPIRPQIVTLIALERKQPTPKARSRLKHVAPELAVEKMSPADPSKVASGVSGAHGPGPAN